jgi:hypothetical protein
MSKPEKGYNGNLSLKRQRTQLNWTQDQLAEFIKCKNDPIYFSEKYIKITHVDHGLIPIDLYDYQKDIIDSTNKHRNTIVLTGRQQGKAVSHYEIIHTPYGIKRFGDIHVGDYVYDQNEKPVLVVYESPTYIDHDCYAVKFSTGETITVDGCHLWTFEYDGTETKSTVDIINQYDLNKIFIKQADRRITKNLS